MLRRIVRALGPHRRRTWPHGGRPSTVQSGAIPYAWAGDEPTFLLITSRRTGRWIFPKGAVESDMTPARSAAKEAWEEAVKAESKRQKRMLVRRQHLWGIAAAWVITVPVVAALSAVIYLTLTRFLG